MQSLISEQDTLIIRTGFMRSRSSIYGGASNQIREVTGKEKSDVDPAVFWNRDNIDGLDEDVQLRMLSWDADLRIEPRSLPEPILMKPIRSSGKTSQRMDVFSKALSLSNSFLSTTKASGRLSVMPLVNMVGHNAL